MRTADDLRAQGDRDLAAKLLKNHDIRKARERLEKEADKLGARRQLLATALRLSPGMAPDVDQVMESCQKTLGMDSPLETYVYPDAAFNAAAVRPERGRMFVLVSSALLEEFEPGELRFVVGHELGHHLFDHHGIPVAAMLAGKQRVDPGTLLRMFAWKRYAEISSDRAGLVCAGNLDSAIHALFKVASGLHGDRIKVQVEPVLQQLEDLREEAHRMAGADEPMRADWFSTHPFSPLRLRAAQLFAASERMVEGGTSMEEVEEQVQDLMDLMDPSYLKDPSDEAEAMRRLLFAGGVLLAAADGDVSKETLEELEDLLGAGSVPSEINPEAIREVLDRRVKAVREQVPPLRRAQVIRDLCIVAQADGVFTDAETVLLMEIADAVDVDRGTIYCVLPDEQKVR